MFKIRGADQKEYGPVSAAEIHEWVAQRRADGRTLVQAVGTAEWRPLAEFPELASPPGMQGGPPPLTATTPPTKSPVTPDVPARTSRMAITSFICGLLGCLVVPSLLGIILGMVSLLRIKRSDGRLKGGGFAIAGICVSAAMLFLVVVIALPLGLLVPALSKARQRASQATCSNNIRQLALGMRLYAGDNKDTFPPADSWCDAVSGYIPGPRVFQCSADRGQRCAFAMNSKVGGLAEDKIPNSQTVLLFEAGVGWNAAGGAELGAGIARHGSQIWVAFTDGSVRQVSATELSALRWDP